MLGDRESFGRNSFQLIRLVLAVAVLYRHSFDLMGTGHVDAVLDLIPPRTHLGRLALCFFMVISGFLVAHSWTQSANWRDFLWRRALLVEGRPQPSIASGVGPHVIVEPFRPQRFARRSA